MSGFYKNTIYFEVKRGGMSFIDAKVLYFYHFNRNNYELRNERGIISNYHT